MTTPTPAGLPSTPHPARPGGPFREAVAFWEPRRVAYNAALVAVVLAWVIGTWPHFRPAFNLSSLGKMLVLALLANACYCAAYLVEIPMSDSDLREGWPRRRAVLWYAGTAFAMLVACYWIGDEIYPDVT